MAKSRPFIINQMLRLKESVNAFLVPIFWFFFHFNPYILILPLLVPKSINSFHFDPFC